MIFRENYLKKPVSVIMFFTFILIIGVISFLRLPVSLMPEQKTPWISIIVEYPGISPEKIENLITKPIEEKIATVSGIKKIESVSEEGKARLNLEFDINKDIDYLILELREKVDVVKTEFPREVQEPLIIKYDPSEQPIIIITMDSPDLNIQDLRDLGENKFKKIFQRVDGVSEIFISGGFQREIHIDINPDKLLARNINIRDVFREVQFANVHLSSGMLYKNRKQMPVLTPWKYTQLEEIEDTGVLLTENGNLIKVKEIGTVKDTHKEMDSISRVNFMQKVSIYIQKSGIANTVEVADNIMKEYNNLKKEYQNINFSIVYNQSDFIRAALNQVSSSVVIGAFIAILVLYLFLRSITITLVIGFSIPISIIATFVFFYFKGISLNVFSLSGLALAAGMLVDNSIIVIENIFARKDVVKGVHSIEKPAIASTLTTVAVFLPIVFTNKEVQLMYGDITLSIIFSIMVSLFTALVLLPVVADQILNKKFYTGKKIDLKVPAAFQLLKTKFLVFLARLDSNPLYRNIKNRFMKFDADKMKRYYLQLLNRSISDNKKVLIGTILLIVLTILISPFISQEYIDPMDTGSIRVFIELPSGTNLEETDKNVKYIESLLNKDLKKYIKQITSRVEKAHCTLVLELKKDINITSEEFIRRAKKYTGHIKEADIIFSQSSASEDMAQKEIDINLMGKDNEKLKQIAYDIAREFNTIKYITDVIFHFKPPQEQICIYVDREKAVLQKLNAMDIANFMREAIYGPVTTKFFTADREIDVRVKMDQEYFKDIEDISKFYVQNNEGDLIPLVSVCQISKSKAPSKIYRVNKHRTVSMAVKYNKIDLNKIVRLINKKLSKYSFPQDYTYEFGTNYKNLVRNRSEMIFAIIFAFLLIYMILASIFEHLLYPFIIILSIPVAIAFVILVLFLTGNSLNIAVYIGLIMLGGIVVNNGIILVDSINEYRQAGIPVKKALVDSSYNRLRPIFMTTLTTVLGLLPVLIFSGEGSNLWQPLALTIITGLTFSTVLTLFIIPSLYFFLYEHKII